MLSNLQPLSIQHTATILDALKLLDRNHKGFAVVVDGVRFRGTITDGDIRRMFIRGWTINDQINGYKTQSKTLDATANFSDVLDIFQKYDIDFVPILNNGNLHNIITRQQSQIVLLSNITVDWNFDFQSFDDTVIAQETVSKPWGFFKSTVLTDFYQSKVLHVNPLQSLSLQRHNYREEHWLCINGQGEAQIGTSVLPLFAGRLVFIPKAVQHRLRNTSDTENLIVVEVQLGESFREDDIERLEDDYNRL